MNIPSEFICYKSDFSRFGLQHTHPYFHTLKRANTTSSHRLANEKLKIIARTSNQLRSMNTTKSAEHSICKIHLGICVYMDFLCPFSMYQNTKGVRTQIFSSYFFLHLQCLKREERKRAALNSKKKKATKRK